VNTFWMFDARTNLGRSGKFGAGGRLKASPLRSIPMSKEDLSKAKGEWKIELSQPFKSVPRLGRGLVVSAAMVALHNYVNMHVHY
jgi:hypothetical protein